MAKKIKGITVQIGGDTSGLTKALSSADKALAATQRELNEVQKGLKLDPTNVELMRQKQELLSEAIRTTADKLKALEDNQEKARKAFEANAEWERQYAPLKEQIDAARASLTELKKKQEEAKAAFEAGRISSEDYERVKSDVKAAEQALADLRQQKKDLEAQFENGHITADEYREYQREVENTRSRLQNLQTELRSTSAVSEEQRKKITEFGDHAKETFKGVVKAAAAITAALLAIGKQAVETGAEFDKSMSEVAATMGYSVDEINTEGTEANKTFKQLRDYAQQMGKSTAFSANSAAEALNYLALSGKSADESIQMLPGLLNLASAGNMELAKTSDVVTDAQSALGLSIEDTEKLIDQMAKTASKSNTSVEQLGEGILNIGATAKDMRGGTKELTEVLGLLADNGIKGAEGGTKLRNILLKLEAPTEKAAAKLEELGVKAYDSDGKLRSMQDIFTDLNAAMADMTEQDKSLAKATIFNARDLGAVNALLNTSVTRWNQLGEVIEDSAGAAQDMAEVQLDNLAGDVTLFKSALEGAEIAISDRLTPSLRNAVQFGTAMVSRLADGFGKGGLAGAVEQAHKVIAEQLGEEAKLVFGIETAVEAAAAAFITYKTTMLMTEAIAALKTVNQLLIEGKTLTEALNAASMANPYVLIATIAAAAATAVKKLLNIQTDLIDETADSYDLLNDKQKETVDNINDLAQTVGKSRTKWKEQRDALEKQATAAKGLAEELYRLDEQEQLSNADKEKMNAIVKELNSSVDGLNIKLDEETGHLITQKSTIDALIASYERQAKAQAAQERLTELYKEQFEAEKNLEQAERSREGIYTALGQKQLELSQAQIELDKWEQQQSAYKSTWTHEQWENYRTLTANVEAATQALKDQEDVIGEVNTAYTTASETSRSVSSGISEMTGILVENGEQVQTAAEAMEGALGGVEDSAESTGEAIVQAFDVDEEIENAVSRIEEIIKAYDDKLAARTGTLQNWFDVNATVDPEDASFDSFNSLLDQQIADMDEWAAGIQQLEDEGINQNFLDKLKDAGPASQAYVKALLDVPEKDRNAYANKWDKAYKSAAETAEKQLKAMRDASNEEIQGILDDAESRGVDFETVFHNLAIDASQGYIDALRDSLPAVKALAQELADATSGTVEEELDISSPSKVMRRIGEFAGEGFGLGIGDEMSRAVKASQQLVDAAIKAGEAAAENADISLPDMSAAAKTVGSYRAAMSAPVSTPPESAGETAAAVKQALSEIVTGNVEIVAEIDGDRLARVMVPKIDLLQGQNTVEVMMGYAGA